MYVQHDHLKHRQCSVAELANGNKVSAWLKCLSATGFRWENILESLQVKKPYVYKKKGRNCFIFNVSLKKDVEKTP